MLKKSIWVMLTLLMLAACGNKEEDLSADEKLQSVEDEAVGFEMNGGNVDKAENVPVDQEKVILASFDEYIAALNAEEIDRYMQTISKNAKGFDYEEEREYVAEAFEKLDIKREVDNVTIAKYSEKEAQVYANIKMHSLQLETDVELEGAGRQVTVFVKEGNDWKVSSIHYIGDDSKSKTGS